MALKVQFRSVKFLPDSPQRVKAFPTTAGPTWGHQALTDLTQPSAPGQVQSHDRSFFPRGTLAASLAFLPLWTPSPRKGCHSAGTQGRTGNVGRVIRWQASASYLKLYPEEIEFPENLLSRRLK